MERYQNKCATIDEYFAGFPAEIQIILETIRDTIQKAAPGATEAISYMIPTFKFHGNLVHFAAFKNHIGFYPGAAGIKEFEKKLVAYNTSKGTVQFPLGMPVPLDLIAEITKYRVIANLKKANSKQKLAL